MGVAVSPASVLDYQIHLLDAFGPDDGVVFPKRFHRDVLFVNSLFAIQISARAPIPIPLAAVRNITKAPSGGFATRRFLDDLRADVDSPVAIVHRSGPILG